jgi:hypothetical protein
MFRQFQISINEHKLILFTTLLAFSILLSSFFVLIVKSYNESVEQAEIEKKYVAENNKESINFTICNFGMTYPEVWSRFHSFSWLPIIYLLLWKNKSSLYWLSSVLTFIPLANFLLWFEKTQKLKSYRELQISHPSESILYDSNSFDVIVFFLVSLLLVWQATILFRILLKAIRYEKSLP